ncbi:MAG TPA: GIY-YIG nuclease family protein [Thiolapillus brandeum]|uniref:GIY-YIG nuclease family protein n=1 Tax=Thiolapillus brandeum TaxID=1076588 RepID=A0A7C5IYA6_9GAMM|nr:GIY-YIG nuclease family protein [Thiolapillus brandeum]
MVYIIRCSDGSLYTGITNDLPRRFDDHRRGRGAKYFRGREPLEVVHLEFFPDRASASRREWAIKAMSRPQKLELITGSIPSASPA